MRISLAGIYPLIVRTLRYTRRALPTTGPWIPKSFKHPNLTWRPRGLSKSVTSRVIIGVTPFRVLTILLITCLLSPLGLQADPKP